MARGYYEMPQGKSQIVYGPPRPRHPLAGSPSNDSSLRSSLPPTTCKQSVSYVDLHRCRIVVLGPPASLEMFGGDLSARLSHTASIEFVENIRDGLAVLAQQPDIVLAPTSQEERAAWSALSSDIIGYISKGGRVVTHPSQLQHLLNEPLGMNSSALKRA